jgi:hypothetical protein
MLMAQADQQAQIDMAKTPMMDPTKNPELNAQLQAEAE